MTMTKKTPYISVLLKKTDYNGKITEIESKIRSITGWTILVALNTVENKIAAVSNLVKKKYIYIYMMQKFLILNVNIFLYLIIRNLQNELTTEQDKIAKTKNGTQTYWVFQQFLRYFK